MENQNISLQVEKFPDLKSFLAGHRSPPDGKFTHTSMCRGKYFIPEEKMEEMYSLYTQDTFEKGKEQRLTEKPHDISPLRVDLDFRYTGNNLERRYTQEMIIEVAKRYMEPVEDWLFLEDNERLCFVTEKSNPQETTKKTEDGQKIYKDGVHLMWPYLLMGTELQLKFREHVYKNLEDVLGPMNLTNPYSDVVDKAVIDKNNWMLYGGQKMGSEPYKLTHVYRVSSDDAEEVEGAVEEYSNAELVRLLSVRSHYTKPLSEQDASVNIADITRTECQVRAEKEAELKEHLKEFVIKMSKYKAPKGPRKKKSKPKKLSEDELNLMKKCVEALNPQRASNYATWMEVGWALHNTDDRLLEDWITFSKQDQNYALTAEEECTKLWDDMFDEGLGVGSLRMWAKNDSPEMYEEIRNTECLKAIRESIQMPDTLGDEDLDKALGNLNVQPADVANVVHQMFRNEFVCISSQGKGKYYKFNRHRWELMDGNVLLRKRLSHDVYRAYMNHLKRIVEGASQGNVEDIAVNNSWLKDNKKIQRLVSCLKGTTFKNNVMDECKELFYDWTESTDGRKHKPFVQKLDSDPNLLGFDNGVFDFGKMEFRDGRPEDHISMSTNIDYKSDLSWENEEVEEVMTFLSQVLPDEDECEYVCVLLASFLNGNNRHEEFHIWTGSGGNGKSKLIELYQKVIGDYGCNLPISLLTSKRKSSGEAQPEVARTKGKRFAILQEPDTYTTINVGLMKELTGGDNIISRALYENPVEFKPQFKMILTCNKLPKLPYDDEGTWRRVRCVEFKSRFVNQEDLDTTDPYCQVKDPTLAEKFDNWKEAFMWILIEKYRVWMKDGLKAPKSVVNFTKQYREQSDAFADFRDEYIIADKKCTEPLIIKDVWNAYNEWHTSNGEGKRGSKKELQIYLEKKLGQMYGVGQIGWKGYRLKNSFEDEVIDNGLD